jgi:deoxyribodipyrimidine photo-lyase
MKYASSLVWFRNDLRIHDNITLSQAITHSSSILPVYCLPDLEANTNYGFQKIGPFRRKFLAEALIDLTQNLQYLGADLLVIQGNPAEALLEIAKKHQIEAIYFSEEVGVEEKVVADQLEVMANKEGIATHSFFQSTLYHPHELPFDLTHLPEIFTSFRHKCEKQATFGTPLPSPHRTVMQATLANTIDLSTMTQEDNACPYRGGESEAAKRLQTYFWEKDALKNYKDTRNGMLGLDYSSKFSPYLALGCISPRTIAAEVMRYESDRVKNESTYWMLFELLWRDYFKFVGMKHGPKIFRRSGIQQKQLFPKRDEALFSKWMLGKTGIPLIDANMRELIHTGFMSNRGRQLVASFLVNDLKLDWTWGAAFFERMLVDYDVTSNWCNWMYVAGVGNDPRPNRYFNIMKQGLQYDPDGDYVRHWIPELQALEKFDIHIPFSLSEVRLQENDIVLGSTYPHPIVILDA